ncbi:MAG: hypothetical protein B1H13_00395 [Desulfobacteraceae bacterium 4484_190.3]|nr:MAG: hypothetical protein B1H13_00395 [Desulfobacteraceae bacterium 4484_190.3]
MNTTEELADFVINTRFDLLAEDVIEQAKKCFLDWLGVAFGGANYPIANILTGFIDEIGGKDQATILGKRIRTNVLNAALTNGAISHVLDFDDTHTASLCHVSSPIMPVVFALGESKHISGKECIAAFVSGFETSARIGMAMEPDHYDAGWHATSTMGRLGAVAAAGRLLGLSRKQMRRAIGIAATQSGGFTVVFGTMCKPFHPGKSALDGMLAAMLAARGFDGPENILETEKGFCRIFSKHVDFEKITNGLGEHYELLNNTFKPYASCLLTHPSIDAALDLRSAHNISPAEIEKIEVTVTPLVTEVAGKERPRTALEGKFSIYYCIAVALLEGGVGEDKFTDERMMNKTLSDLQQLISVNVNPEFNNTTAELSIKTIKGDLYTKKILVPRGDPRNPLSFSQLGDKFRILAKKIFPEERISKLIYTLRRLEELEEINQLVELCS